MSDEAPAGFEEPLLETRQGPVLDGHGENKSAQEIAEVVGDHPEEQPHLIGPEPVTGEAGPVGGGLALLDPLLGRPALVVEADDCSVRPQRGDDEAYSGKQFPPRRGASMSTDRRNARFGLWVAVSDSAVAS